MHTQMNSTSTSRLQDDELNILIFHNGDGLTQEHV